jgi:hypothetical protein
MHIIILILALLPIVYKYTSWLYEIQEMDYSWSKFKKRYKKSSKTISFNHFWLVLEIPLLILSFFILVNPPYFEWLITFKMFYFLAFENIYILWHIFRWNINLPKFNKLNTIILLVIWLAISLDIYFIIKYYYLFLYSYVFIIMLFNYIILYAWFWVGRKLINKK